MISVSPKSDNCIPVTSDPFSDCFNCGRRLPPNGVVCPHCGKPRPFGRLIQNIKVYGTILALIGGMGVGVFEQLTGSAKREAADKKSEQMAANSKKGQLAAPMHFSSVAEAQTEAVRRHPDLGVKGSKFNAAFIDRYKAYQREFPGYFSDNSWPVRLADEIAASANQP